MIVCYIFMIFIIVTFSGMNPVDKKEMRDKQKLLEERFTELGVKPTMLQHIVQSNGGIVPTLKHSAMVEDLEWDNDLTSEQSTTSETRGLLSRGNGRHTDEEADR